MIEQTIERWHAMIAGDSSWRVEDLLADDVVFYSPVVYTPQRGKEITLLYLGAAGNTLGDKDKFRYTKQVLSDNQAVLEFETEMDGTYVNGVDIITCNSEGLITEFRVMVRPLQAIQKVHAAMAAMLQQMQKTERPMAAS